MQKGGDTCLKGGKKQMNDSWMLIIIRTANGYYLSGSDGVKVSIEEDESDELLEHEKLLWEVMEFFNFQGSKHDAERLRIVRQKHET